MSLNDQVFDTPDGPVEGFEEFLKYIAKDSIAFRHSCHTFASETPTSAITRNIKDVALEVATSENEKQAKRRQKKRDKILELQIIRPEYSIFCSGVGFRKTFFSGSLSKDLPGVSRYATVYCVSETLRIVDTTEGCHMPDTFTLVPRDKMIRRYNEMKSFNGIMDTLDYVTSIKCANPRSTTNREVIFEGQGNRNYVNLGTKASRNSRGLCQDMKGLVNQPNHLKLLASLQSTIEHAAAEYIDHESLTCIRNVQELSGYPGFPLSNGRSSSIWPALAVAQNVFLQVHEDQDYFMSATTTLHPSARSLAMDDTICNYFCFPKQGVAVAIRNGDLLLFNPLKSHCVSSRCNSDQVYYNVSLYLKTAVVGGNDNSRIM